LGFLGLSILEFTTDRQTDGWTDRHFPSLYNAPLYGSQAIIRLVLYHEKSIEYASKCVVVQFGVFQYVDETNVCNDF